MPSSSEKVCRGAKDTAGGCCEGTSWREAVDLDLLRRAAQGVHECLLACQLRLIEPKSFAYKCHKGASARVHAQVSALRVNYTTV